MATAIRDIRESAPPCAWPMLESMEDALRTTRRTVADARHASEDLADAATLEVRRHPLRAVGIAAGGGLLAGALAGFAAGWFTRTRG